jgi:hypothetical protein
MRYKIWHQFLNMTDEEAREEDVVFLSLWDSGESIQVVACNKIGELRGAGHILGIRQETGKLKRYSAVATGFGLSLDRSQRIVEEG